MYTIKNTNNNKSQIKAQYERTFPGAVIHVGDLGQDIIGGIELGKPQPGFVNILVKRGDTYGSTTIRLASI